MKLEEASRRYSALMGSMTPDFIGGHAAAKYERHCIEHFDEVVEALEKTQNLYAILVQAKKSGPQSKSGIFEYELDARSDANVMLLAKAKKVK
jgi:hypothetical protein